MSEYPWRVASSTSLYKQLAASSVHIVHFVFFISRTALIKEHYTVGCNSDLISRSARVCVSRFALSEM